MSALPPSPGYPPTEPPTAQHPERGQEPGDQPFPGARPRISPALTGVIGAVVGAGLALAAALPLTLSGGAGTTRAASSPPSDILAAATEACDSPAGVTLEDDGTTLAFDHRGDDEVIGGDFTDIMCVFTELGMPSRISTHMGQTTSMDGRQTASWDALEIQWSYHPDRGMDGIVTVATG